VTGAAPAVKVSVVIPAYNAAPFIERTLDSVLAQGFADLEVIVVDDGSTDDTRDIVSAMDRPIVLVRGPQRGVSLARNAGIRLSVGEYVAFMDHDDLWEPDKIRRQVEALDAEPRAGLVFTQARMMERGRLTRVFPLIADEAPFLANAYENLVHENYIPMSSVMVRRASLPGLDGSGPFDPQLQLAEDWDLWLRIAQRHSIVYIPEPLTRYVIVPGRATERIADLRLEDLAVVQRQIRANPWLASSDAERCKATLYRLNEEAGYWLLREGRHPEARRALRAAWKLKPASIKPLGFIVASFLGWTPTADVPS
jgi:glycosyltransferase involved in cell wall biosynthesis